MEPTEGPGRSSSTQAAAFWVGSVLALAVLLAGRFDWSPDVRSFSARGYLSSLVLLVPTIVAAWGVSRWLWPGRKRVARAAIVATGVLLALPYHWLGLHKLHYYRDRPVAYVPERVLTAHAVRSDRNAWGQETWATAERLPPADFRPSILLHAPRGSEGLVPAALGLGSLLGGLWLWRRRRGASSAAVGLGLLALLAGQAWAHLSQNSPYSYVTHHYLPLEANYWHVASLLGDGQGVVNADVVVFHDLEEHFWGTPRATNTMLIRRPFFSYLAAQLTYFFNAFQVFVGLNLVAWAAAVACVYDFARREIDERAAQNAAVLTACGPGFLMYVGQPTCYLAAYAGSAFVVWATARTMGPGRQPRRADWVTLATILGLTLLLYDAFGWFLFVTGYALLRKVPLRPVLATLAAASGLYVGFLALQTRVLGLAMDTTNTRPLAAASATLLRLVTGARVLEVYPLTLELARVYAGGLAAAFFILPAVLALGGLALPRDRRQTGLVLLLFAPSLAGVAFLCYGQATWAGERLASMPRFTYPAFPAIYLLAGSAIATLQLALESRGRPRLGRLLTWILLGSAIALANVDVLLGWPQLYYWFYWGGGGHF